MSIRPTFFGIEIARTGLTVSQKGLDVTGHNIANVDTAGYTRQRLVNTAYEPYSAVTQFKPVDRALIGSGAHIMIHDQIRSKFLDRQYRTEQTLLSNWQARTQGLNYVESLFQGSDMSTLSDGVNKLFSAFNTLTTEANDLEQRKLIQQSAINLTTQFHLIHERLIDQQTDQNLAVETVVGRINTIAESISVLNKSIYSFELDGDLMANDLRDKRNLLLDELSSLVDISYEETPEDKFVLKIGGVELVNHVTVSKMECRPEENSLGSTEPSVSVPYWAGSGTPGIKVDIKGGELKAHIDLRDNITSDTPGIPYFIEQLNTLARALVQTINNVHKQGFTHPANSTGDSIDGTPFFDESLGIDNITAGNIKLSDAIKNDAYNIAASTEKISLGVVDPPEEMVPGNQNNARAIYELLNSSNLSLTLSSGPVSIGSYHSFITGMLLDVATTLEHSKTMTSTQSAQVLAVDNQRTSISGVSLDEEMTNLIKYQHAYSGSSRVITAMDEALDMLINRMGLVGRG